MSAGMWIALSAIGVLFLAAIAYWQLVVAEGAYLGTRIVALLYDWFAPRYDRVKQYDKATDALMLALPVMQHLAAYPHTQPPTGGTSPRRLSTRVQGEKEATVLDVGTGTGRLPDTLLSQPRFTGRIVAIDASAKMLGLAHHKLAKHVPTGRVTLMQRDAQSLPFDNDSFDVVTCLEALEFMRDWRGAMREMVRVLKPGGLLMVSNRIGPDAWKLPGRAIKSDDFVIWLSEMGVDDAHPQAWLVDYDLVMGTKSIC